MPGLILMTCLLSAPPGATPIGGSQSPMTLGVSSDPSLANFETFLLERAQETWDFEPASLEKPEPDFHVRLAALNPQLLSVTVARAGAPITERTFEIVDPLQTKLTLWLLVKSTISRGLQQGASATSPKAEPKNVTVAQSKPTQSTPQVHHRRQTARVSTPGKSNLALLAGMWLETPDLFALGVSGGVWLSKRRYAVGALLGYRVSTTPRDMSLHVVPVTGWVALQTRSQIAAAIGVGVTAEMKLARSQSGTQPALGIGVGPFVEVRGPFSEDLGVVFRTGVDWRLRRQLYRYVSDGQRREVREHPWAASMAIGVSW